MGIAATLGAAFWLIALGSVATAAACYFVVPWERVVDADAGPDGVDQAAWLRVGVSAGVLTVVPMLAGAWLQFTRVVMTMDAREASPTTVERVAAVVPGEALLLGSLLAGFAAVLAPVWVGLAVRIRRAVGG